MEETFVTIDIIMVAGGMEEAFDIIDTTIMIGIGVEVFAW